MWPGHGPGLIYLDTFYQTTVGCKSVPTFLGFNSDFSDSFGTFCPFGRGLKPGPENDPTQNWAQNQRGTPRGAGDTEIAKIVGL